MPVKIYHNPHCSKSRQTLDLLHERDLTPMVIDYLKTPPDMETLRELAQMLRVAPMQLVRRKESEFAEAGLGRGTPSDDEVLAAIHAFPRLLERPIVVCAGRAAIGRPPEAVLDIL